MHHPLSKSQAGLFVGERTIPQAVCLGGLQIEYAIIGSSIYIPLKVPAIAMKASPMVDLALKLPLVVSKFGNPLVS